jgi:glycosyltransferase involved in cell wall biosynthesis
MRIAIISHAYVEPGYSSVLESMVAYPGLELALITPERYRGRFQTSQCQFASTVVGLHTYALPIMFGQRQGAFIYRPAALSRALADFRPDLILHEQEVYAAGAGQIAAIATQESIPLVMFVWENVHRSLLWPRRRLVRYVLERCAGLIAGSAGAAQVHHDWGFKGPMTVIPQMGIPQLNPAPVFGRRNGNCFHVSFAGRLVAAKGIDCLLRAVAEVRSKGINLECKVVGRGAGLQKLISLRNGLGIGNAVEITGPLSIEDVRAVLARSDALVLPSRRTKAWEEQFGLILIEAMAEATVTIGSRTGAIPGVIASEDLLFDEDDHRQLAAILERLAANEAELAGHQHRLWLRAARFYTNESLTTRRLDFLKGVYLAANPGESAESYIGATREAASQETAAAVEPDFAGVPAVEVIDSVYRGRGAILTNMLVPSRIPIYEVIGSEFDLTVLTSKHETNRMHWRPAPEIHSNFSVRETFGFMLIERKRVNGHVFDYKYLQVPVGAILELLHLRPDWIISNEMGFRSLIALFYSSVSGTPLWVWWGGTKHTERRRGFVRTMARKFFVNHVKHWISYGTSSTEYLQSIDISSSRILTIQNCSALQSDNVRSAHSGGQSDKPRFLCVGQLIGRKGIDLLIRCLASLKIDEGLHCSLTLVGSGPEKASLQRQASNLGLDDVHFAGHIRPEDTRSFYANADCLVFPSLEDVWGLVINEAIIAGVPILCSIYAGCVDDLVPQECRFDPTNAEDFKRALRSAFLHDIRPIPISVLRTPESIAQDIIADIEAELVKRRCGPRGAAILA